jgi:hypothetical protein
MAGSAFFIAMYLANGVVYGSLVGLKGRESDLQIARIRSSRALAIALVLQVVAIVMTMLSLARPNLETSTFSFDQWCRTFWRLAISIIISIIGTALIFMLILKVGKFIGF